MKRVYKSWYSHLLRIQEDYFTSRALFQITFSTRLKEWENEETFTLLSDIEWIGVTASINAWSGNNLTIRINFDVLLTVHLSIFISVLNQLDAQKFWFTISLFHASTYFEHICSSSGGQNRITQPLVSSHLQMWRYQRLCNAILTSWWKAVVLETCRGVK